MAYIGDLQTVVCHRTDELQASRESRQLRPALIDAYNQISTGTVMKGGKQLTLGCEVGSKK
jgi:hypothetical protein